MSIKLNSITDLKEGIESKNKDILTDADYKLRDKKEERSNPETAHKNTRDISDFQGKYKEQIDKIKAEVRAETLAEVQSSGFIETLKAQLLAELKTETTPAPEEPKKGGK